MSWKMVGLLLPCVTMQHRWLITPLGCPHDLHIGVHNADLGLWRVISRGGELKKSENCMALVDLRHCSVHIYCGLTDRWTVFTPRIVIIQSGALYHTRWDFRFASRAEVLVE